ncbi:type II toxin-antitoxin system Phd/YefM family antitoxin [Microcystis aeruginosa]|uniref:type II toxin-antitoxin system Phd/YefM family antitoxin n=1 Tax=Microcystis aeruginosa TaxID=1126 RepID=UPI00187E3AC6|nr:type II toxin-antitoxin system prevent-host-death family antitoxin [Microcystis aeruginosa]MBE8994618.1 type II toxin-antitoxin system prevent-host-death family antitoxin [Microcystis aeruginosa LEGE 91341]
MTTVELKQAKNQLNELLEAVLKGEEIIITENNEPVVKLSSVKLAKKPPRQPRSAAEKVGIADNFDAPLTDFEDYQ